MTTQPSTPDLSLKLFGGILVSDAGGLYPGIELFNCIYCCKDGILPDVGTPSFFRIAHDYARRLVWDTETFLANQRNEGVLLGDQATAVVKGLLECLKLKVPDRRSTAWEAAHFFPYSRSLVHWDARERNGRIRIERRYLRGGGEMAFHVLRRDPDAQRLKRVRDRFKALMPEAGVTALERITGVLAERGHRLDAAESELSSGEAFGATDSLDEAYRSGIDMILSYDVLSSTERIRAVVIWTGFWTAVCQVRRAAIFLGRTGPDIVVDCGSEPGQVRRESSRDFKDAMSTIGSAAEKCLTDNGGGVLKTKARRDLEGYFARSCAWVGLSNAFAGKRHFTLSLDLLQTLVMAHISPRDELPFEQLAGPLLRERYGMIVGRAGAAGAGLLTRLDASIFEDNEEQLARQLAAAGLLIAYSDSTRMVSIKVAR